MPRKVPVPRNLIGSAFRTSDSDTHGLGRGRLRNRDVQHPFRGMSSIGLDLSAIIPLCRAYEPLLRSNQHFSHTTAAALHGIPLPQLGADPLHVSCSDGGAPPRRSGVAGHLTGPVELDLAWGLPTVAPADTWCQLATIIGREDFVAAGDYLVSGERLPGGGRSAPKCTPAELAAAGRPTLHGDLAYPEWRMVLEYEGKMHRLSARRFLSDIERRELFEAEPWRVVRVTSLDLFTRPETFLSRVRGIVELRENHPW